MLMSALSPSFFTFAIFYGLIVTPVPISQLQLNSPGAAVTRHALALARDVVAQPAVAA